MSGQLLLGCGLLCFIWIGFRFAFSYVNDLIDHKPDHAYIEQSRTAPDTTTSNPDSAPVEVVQVQTPTPTSKTPKPAKLLPKKPQKQDIPVAEERIVLRTVGGDIVLALYPGIAPKTVEQLTRLFRAGVYDTTHFNRLEPQFVLQTSVAQDRQIPLSKNQQEMIRPIPGEFSKTLKHRRGVLSMGRENGKPDSAETSFSILLADAPHLDGQYTIFGYVESGMDVVDLLVQTPREPDSNRPAHRLTIIQADVLHQDELGSLTLEKPRDQHLIELQIPPPSTLAAKSIAILQQHCWQCHGGGATKGQLDLTARSGLLRGGEHGMAFNKLDIPSSMLLQRLYAKDQDRMPPKGPALSQPEKDVLSQWLSQGAPYPTQTNARRPVSHGRVISQDVQAHWAWQPLTDSKPPSVKDAQWCNNAIDQFVLSKLESKGLTPAQQASPHELERRLSYGLIGLPPQSEQAQGGPTDAAIDRLLASQHYGEQMARFWLDLVRYADSDGYEDDKNRPLAYTYRDFLIRAFNDDLPFDQLVQWQIAGDEIAPEKPEARAATGFLAAGPYQTFFPKKKDRFDELDDIVSTSGIAFLGMTVGCARCHDHKHDPISQYDYYRLVSVFHGSKRQEGYLDYQAGRKYETLREPVEQMKRDLDHLRMPAREKARNEKIDGLPIKPHEKEALRLPIDPNNDLQAGLLRRYEHLIQLGDDDIRNAREEALAQEWDNLEARIIEAEQQLPVAPQKGLVYEGSHVTPSPFLERGDINRERELVNPGFITFLTRGRPVWRDETWKAWGESPRKAYASWLTDLEAGAGLLTARVIVNRIWQIHFGVGLVRTANDFGVHGEIPGHPELLDWLASDFIAHGWKLKRLHRMIVSSKTYQLSSLATHQLTRADPENRLLGRHTPQRLSAENLRDSILTVCGNLNREMYGVGIRPAIPRESIFQTAPKHGIVWPENAPESPENWRRSIYIFAKRSNPVPALQLFDAPDASVSCARRNQSTVPTQALALLNDPFLRNQAKLLSQKILKQTQGDAIPTIRSAYRTILGRDVSTEEIAQSGLLQNSAAKGKGRSLTQDQVIDLCHVLMMTNEFLYVN